MVTSEDNELTIYTSSHFECASIRMKKNLPKMVQHGRCEHDSMVFVEIPRNGVVLLLGLNDSIDKYYNLEVFF